MRGTRGARGAPPHSLGRWDEPTRSLQLLPLPRPIPGGKAKRGDSLGTNVKTAQQAARGENSRPGAASSPPGPYPVGMSKCLGRATSLCLAALEGFCFLEFV